MVHSGNHVEQRPSQPAQFHHKQRAVSRGWSVRLPVAILLALYLFSAVRFGQVLLSHITMVLIVVFGFLNLKKIGPLVITAVCILACKEMVDFAKYGFDERAAMQGLFVLLTIIFIEILHKLSNSGKITRAQLNVYILLSCAHGVFILYQFVSFNIFKDYGTLNPFGAYSQFGPDPLSGGRPGPYNPFFRSNTISFIRPNGLNWEPSAAAFWATFAISVLLSRFRQIPMPTLKIGILSISVVATGSFLGLAHLVILFAAMIYQIIRNTLLRMMMVCLAIATLLGLFELNIYTSAGRIEEIWRPGTSGYVRVTAPLLYLRDQGVSLFGSLPLGSKAYSTYSAFISAGRTSYSTIENALLQYIIYFGIVGVIFYFIVTAKVARASIRSNNLPLIMTFLFAPLYGGHVFNPIFIVAVGLWYMFSTCRLKGRV
ncbi:hypothetical protein [Novosphingobium naphthalenivorans]|uniref:hypothetical protein n=1 Tax=Novosphingobium naphthalenivorans TaxID=273168 RepID=UPI000AECB0B3|nr:hypothetical protein [Novosphingobium naphthalenivorans]